LRDPATRTHSRTWAEIDLGAVRHNVRTLLRRASGARLMAVVKADAYGHGAVPVARAAIKAGAHSLAVVTVEEGVELRRAGIAAPILIFTDLHPDRLLLARVHDLAATAHSLESARRVAAVPNLSVHLKVNTGMNRWGVQPEEVGEAVGILGDGLVGIYTHLAAADGDDEATRRQLGVFDKVLASRSFAGLTVHAANSAGTLWHPASHHDLVRPGVALYGLHPLGDAGDPAAEDLRPAMSLRSYVASVRRLEGGEGVSYGLTWRAGRDTYAATVPVGYAEGYRRALSGRAEALIGGRRRSLLGRVTMDACVFEVDESVVVGDEVVLLGTQGGERVGAEELGRLASTINYEVTTGVDPRRVERSYGNV
jgi:alanine racemase